MTNSAYLLSVATAGIVLLAFLIIRGKLHPFIAMLLAAAFVGLGSGMAPEAVLASMQAGMGGTLGFVATIVALGAMFGQFLEESGGVHRIALSLVRNFGTSKSQWALVLIGFLVAIPVFFEVGLIILMPLVYSLTKQTGRSLLYYGIPLAAGLAVTHAFIPPTPGPVAVASILGADIGSVILFGALVGVPTAIVAGVFWGRFIGQRIHVDVPHHINDLPLLNEDELPPFRHVITLLILPLVLILSGSLADQILAEGALKDTVVFVGHPFIALTIAACASFYFLGRRQGMTSEQVRSVASKALEPAALVILVTGAGGMFKQVLVDSGVGPVFGEVVAASAIPPLLAAFLIALAVRIIQGSATVAMLTAAGLVAPTLVALDASQTFLALATIAIAGGASAMSHVNDTGFWIVNRYFDMSVKDTFRSWTMMGNILGAVSLSWVLILALLLT